jgi:L-fuculose-phosphate aldolase
MVGPIASIDYATPGTDRLAENLEKHLAGHNAFILKNHGALTLGKNMDEAFRRMEIVENLARIAYIASALGKIDLLSKDEIHRLEKIRESLKSDGFADD